jgi:16S rRNA (adenine1518-N6/adenine1519-N6)-dimethyltransferase
MNTLLSQTLGLLRRYDLRARKGLGQHFLIDAGALDKIISAAELSANDTVVEIGPGLGVLTDRLTENAGRVIAIELDSSLAARLRERLADRKNLSVLNEDVLKIDPGSLFGKEIPASYKVVANLPYYITSPVLRHFLEAVSVQLYGLPSMVTVVPAASFYPAPKVDSAVVKIQVYPSPAAGVTDPDSFFRVVKAGFKAARKQIGNSLAQGLNIPKLEALALLERAGIDSLRRAETLTLAEWAALWRVCEVKSTE